MTKRPLLIFNGKPRRYAELCVELYSAKWLTAKPTTAWQVRIDSIEFDDVRVSFSTRPSGRRVIWVHAEVDNG